KKEWSSDVCSFDWGGAFPWLGWPSEPGGRGGLRGSNGGIRKLQRLQVGTIIRRRCRCRCLGAADQDEFQTDNGNSEHYQTREITLPHTALPLQQADEPIWAFR